ncbi:MAG: hypothetical protein IJ128_03545 [Firmicutes bacterium]|nr:hypothetical protein [Bacillota bacterium]
MKHKMIMMILAVFLLLPAGVFAGTIGEPDAASYLTKTAADGESIYVMTTFQSKQIRVDKYSPEDTEEPLATWIMADGQYWAGGASYNGAMSVGPDGMVYVAATKGAGSERQLMVYKLDGDLKLQSSKAFGSMTSPNPSGTFYNPEARDIAVSESGDIYIAGDSREPIEGWTDPVFPFERFEKYSDSGQRAGRRIGYVVRLDQDLALQKCTYLGSGSNGGTSAVNRILCEGRDLYVLGRDASGQVPTAEDSLQPQMTPLTSYSDSFDAFLVRMDGLSLQAESGTYYGGTGTEEVADMKISGSNIYVLGDTTSDDIPLSEEAYGTERASASSFYTSPFLLRIHKSLKRTDAFAATYFGDGASRIDSFGLDVSGGRVYITGTTKTASSVPVTDGSNTGHIFIAILTGDLSALRSATVLGTGASGDDGRGILKVGGSLYLAGTLGTEGLLDTQIRQPFLEQIPESLAHARLARLAMKDFVNAVQYYGAGKQILLKLSFDANVGVSGSPALKLNIRNGENEYSEAEYLSGSGTRDLIFAYTVRPGDTTGGNRLVTAGSEPFLMEAGSSISPSAGEPSDPADLTIPEGTANRLEYSGGDRVYINTIPAHAESVTASAAEGTYSEGDVIPIIVTVKDDLGSPVKLTLSGGTPVLKLNCGGQAVFREFVETAGGNDGRMLFEYTVGAKDEAESLDYRDPAALDLQGAVLTDPYETPVDVTLPQPGQEGSISADKAIVIERAAGPEDQDIDAVTPSDAAADAAAVDQSLPVIAAGAVATTGSLAKKQMKLSWPAVNGAVNYRYAWRPADAQSWTYGWTGGKARCTLSGLKLKGLYEFRTAVYAKAGESWARSEWSEPVCRYFQGVSKVSAKAKKGKKIKVAWNKQPGASGYQILYSVKKSMKGAKVRTAKGASKKTVTLKKLKKGKKYYIKVRPYKTWKGKKYIGILSAVKTAKAKK